MVSVGKNIIINPLNKKLYYYRIWRNNTHYKFRNLNLYIHYDVIMFYVRLYDKQNRYNIDSNRKRKK